MNKQERSIPVVRLTLESMQHSILQAFMEHSLQMDEMVQAEVKRVCTERWIREVLAKQVQSSIESAVREQVESFYHYGAGRDVVKRAVEQHLTRQGTP